MFLLITALLVAVDQLTKWWAATTFPLNGQGQYIGLGFYLTYIKNTGAAFGILQDGTLVLGVLSAVVAVLLTVYLLRSPTTARLQRAALTLILAGALGNMIDRFVLGYVRDFIHFQIPSFNFAVFNVADSCVVIGAGLLLISSFLPPHKPEPRSVPIHEETEFSDAEFFGDDELEREPS
ncbi:signal peptidase II [soil metagenome]